MRSWRASPGARRRESFGIGKVVRQLEATLNVSDVWNRALAEIAADQGVTAQQRAFVTLAQPRAVSRDSVCLAAPNDFTRNVMESHLRPHVEMALERVLGHPVTLRVTVDPDMCVLMDEDMTDQLADSTYANDAQPSNRAGWPTNANPGSTSGSGGVDQVVDVREVTRPGMGGPASSTGQSHRLNPKYTFDTFVIGSSNRFAHAAAVAAAEQPAKAYNPLFIYGDSGLGKTHLLHAIGHYTRSMYSGARVRYVSSEEFTNDLINSIRDDKSAAFQRRFREVDVLLVDDIQFLSGKARTMEEFFHTFNTLHNANKQIVVTSDLPPKQLQDFEERLRSRFEWGLITDVQPPELETRIAILSKKISHEGLTVSSDVLEYIASKIETNIRELEGALIRVTAFSSLNRSPVTVEMAEMVLKDLIPDQHAPQITAGLIMRETSEYFSVSIDELCGPSRTRMLVNARQIAMYLCRELTELSLPNIGRTFGGRDHTTVMHAEKKIFRCLADDRVLYNQIADLTSLIKTSAKRG